MKSEYLLIGGLLICVILLTGFFSYQTYRIESKKVGQLVSEGQALLNQRNICLQAIGDICQKDSTLIPYFAKRGISFQ